MKANRIILLLSAAMALTQICQAQPSKSDPADWESRYAATFQFDLPKKWDLELGYEIRYYDDMSAYYGSYYSLELSKGCNSWLTVQAQYRIAYKIDEVSHRVSVGAQAEKNYKKKWEGNLRLLFQNKVDDVYDPSEPTSSSLYWRVRAGVRYKPGKRATLYGSLEPVMEVGSKPFVNNMRYVAGVTAKISKTFKADFYYQYQPDYGKASYNRYYNILGLGLTYEIAIKKKAAGKGRGS